MRCMGKMWRRNGSAVGFSAMAAASVLALVVQTGGAVASTHAPADSRSPTRAITAARGTSVTSTFFGMHAPLLGTAFPSAPVGTVDLTTNYVYWRDLETAPGVFDFTHLDTVLGQAHGQGARPLLVLGLTPSFHVAAGSTAPATGASVPDLAAWKAYVSAVAARYGATLDYQIWPEPNVKSNFTGTPQQLAKLVATASDIIKGVAPRATVVAPAMVLRLKSERTWMNTFFASKVGRRPVGDYVDAVGMDAYPMQAGTPEDSLALITKARAILAARHVTAPLWNLEINYFVPFGGASASQPPSDRLAASYVIRTYVLNAAANVKRVYWLLWGKSFNLGISMAEDDGVTPTAAGQALSRVSGWLLGKKARGCTVDRSSKVYACRFVKGERSSWVYWVNTGSAKVRVPAGMHHVQTMYGVRSAVRPGARLRITNAPVWVSR